MVTSIVRQCQVLRITLKPALAARPLSTSTATLSKASKARTATKHAQKRQAVPFTKAGGNTYGESSSAVATGGGDSGYKHGSAALASVVEEESSESRARAAQGLGEVEDASYIKHGSSINTTSSPSKSTASSTGLPSAVAENVAARSSSDDNSSEYGPESTIYSTQPPYNVPLVLTVSFVISVGCLMGAENARVGLTKYDEKEEEWKPAPAWKRWGYAAGFTAVAVGAAAWGALAPSRIVTKITLRRPLSAPPTSTFPPSSLVTLHTPVSKLPFYPRRTVTLSSVHLLGPLSKNNQPWHPRQYDAPEKPKMKGAIPKFFRNLVDTVFPATKPKSRSANKRSHFTHVPIVVEGDRFSYSLAKTKNLTGKEGDKSGAWCQDWEALERAMLGVEEGKWK
ncbi:hypothetical protein T439DRAFT_329816 [Meredithblackwellia eburnea MCA 4105]